MLYLCEFDRADMISGDDADFEDVFEGPKWTYERVVDREPRKVLDKDFHEWVVSYGAANGARTIRVFEYQPKRLSRTGERHPSITRLIVDIDVDTSKRIPPEALHHDLTTGEVLERPCPSCGQTLLSEDEIVAMKETATLAERVVAAARRYDKTAVEEAPTDVGAAYQAGWIGCITEIVSDVADGHHQRTEAEHART